VKLNLTMAAKKRKSTRSPFSKKNGKRARNGKTQPVPPQTPDMN